jgi:hypothetical protein
VAYARVRGSDPDVYVDTYRTGPKTLHAIAAKNGRVLFDPSVPLGMGSEAPMRNGQRAGIKWKVRREGDTWRGTISMPLSMEGDEFSVSGVGFNPWKALKRTVSVARAAMKSPLIQAAMPPQARLAMTAVSLLSKQAQRLRKRGATRPRIDAALQRRGCNEGVRGLVLGCVEP